MLALTLGGIVSAGSLTACSSTPAAEDGPVTLTLMAYQELRADTVEKLIPQFEADMAAEGKDIKVELVRDILTDEQFKTKITQQYNAGTAPDVVDQNSNFQNAFAGAGYLLPLDPYLDEWDGWDTYYPAIKEGIMAEDGQTYGLPHDAGVYSLFYRKDVLEDMGIDTSQPETWDDLISRLKQITAETDNPSITLPAGTAWGGGSWAEGFGNIVPGTDTVMYDEAAKKWNVDGPGIQATFDLYSELVTNDLLPVQDLLNPTPWVSTKYEAFVEGTIPVTGQGSWGWKYDWGPEGSAPLEGLTEKVATWNFPGLTPGVAPYSTLSVGNVYSVSADSEHPDESMELAKWLSSGEAMSVQLDAIGAAAPRSGIDGIAPYADDPQLLDAEQKLDQTVSVPANDGVDQISQAVQDSTELILTGDATGPEAAAAFAEQATELLGPSRVQG